MDKKKYSDSISEMQSRAHSGSESVIISRIDESKIFVLLVLMDSHDLLLLSEIYLEKSSSRDVLFIRYDILFSISVVLTRKIL